jgi:multiple sugar transport system permease protein
MSEKRKMNIIGYMFLLPSLIGFLIFKLYPILFSLFLAFCEWDLVSGFSNIKFIGLDNFKNMANDDYFISSIRNTFVYVLSVVPIEIVLAMIIAVILEKAVYFKGFFRLVYFMPYISNIVAVSVVWMALYHPSQGPINQLLMAIGIKNPPLWLASSKWAMLALIIMSVWLGIGYCIVIYMAGLQGVPDEIYEAAKIDGANAIERFRYITLPYLSPTTFFLLIVRLIATFQVFGPINIMTEGGPGRATTVLVYHIYRTAFRFYQVGYASAVAFVLFLIILALTLVQWKAEKTWVTYN